MKSIDNSHEKQLADSSEQTSHKDNPVDMGGPSQQTEPTSIDETNNKMQFTATERELTDARYDLLNEVPDAL